MFFKQQTLFRGFRGSERFRHVLTFLRQTFCLQVFDPDAVSKWQIVKNFVGIFEFGKESTEPEALGAKLDCAKAGLAAIKDKQALMRAYESQTADNIKELCACLAASVRSW